jgi:hypothetical protein
MLLNLASCQKCKGDLVHEGDEWRCLQCGTYYYPKAQQFPEAIYPRKTWSINASIQATQASEVRWQSSNREIIEQLSAGSTTRDIASLTNHSPRRIQSVKEGLLQAL